MPDTSVKLFRSTDAGAPSVSSANGTIIGIINACLVDGYGTVTVNPLVVSGNVATGTVSAGHGFAMRGSTGPVITIAGATPSALNGEWRIASVPNSTTFTFATSGISDQTATGTITAKRAPAGWIKPYSGTNKAVYQSQGIGASGCLVRAEDSYADYCRLRAYESMTDIDSGTDPFPTVAQVSDANRPSIHMATASWLVAADAYSFIIVSYNGTTFGLAGFGDFVPSIPSDAHNCFLMGTHPATSPFMAHTLGGAPSLNRWAKRAADGTTKSAQCSLLGGPMPSQQTYVGLGTGYTYPAPGVGGLLVAPLLINDGMIRGTVPGVFHPMHNNPGSDGDIVACVIGGVSRDLRLTQQSYTSTPNGGRIAIDITGPWR